MAKHAYLHKLVVVIAAVGFTPACYTLLKHPTLKESDYRQAQGDRCTSCHLEDEVWGYHHPPGYYYWNPGYYGGWEYYYGLPWWYSSYWYYDPDSPRAAHIPSRNFRPREDKNRNPSEPSGAVGRPPKAKSTNSSINVKQKEDDDNGKAKDEGSKKRSLRPKKNKEKEQG